MSFDYGDHWQALQLNLPATSMRDLVVHGDDIVVGTHGRSFWILDDITPLRQMSTQVAEAGAHLFRPQVSYRMRRSTNTDTPLPPEVAAGENPPDGAIIDYVLKAAPTQPVVLEIFDSTGKLVRRYSSADKPELTNPKELNVPMYWVRPPQVVSALAGMHRFVWDLHYVPPAALRHEYPISAIPHDTPREPPGPRALPGEYTVKLTADGQTLSERLTVVMDPRVKTPAEGLQRQFEMETRIAEAMEQDYAALKQVQSVRTQLKDLQARAGAMVKDIAALDAKLSALEGRGGGFGRGGGEHTLAQLNGALATICDAIDSADAAPTSQAVTAFAEVQRALAQQLAAWDEMKSRDVEALNGKLRQAGLPEVKL